MGGDGGAHTAALPSEQVLRWVAGVVGGMRVLSVENPSRILAGQAAASLTVDHFGLVGFTENPITPGRLLGIALVALGVVLVRVF